MNSPWDGLSPDVDAVLAGGERRQESRSLTRAEKKERSRQAARVRVTLDVPDWLKAELLRLADQEQTSASSIAAFLIARGIRELRKGTLVLSKTASESPKFVFLVEVSESDAGL
jgi:hypothetical protein